MRVLSARLITALRYQDKLNALNRIDDIDAKGGGHDGRVWESKHCPRLSLCRQCLWQATSEPDLRGVLRACHAARSQTNVVVRRFRELLAPTALGYRAYHK